MAFLVGRGEAHQPIGLFGGPKTACFREIWFGAKHVSDDIAYC